MVKKYNVLEPKEAKPNKSQLSFLDNKSNLKANRSLRLRISEKQAKIGFLYNANDQTFKNASLFKEDIGNFIATDFINEKNHDYLIGDNFRDKLTKFEIEPSDAYKLIHNLFLKDDSSAENAWHKAFKEENNYLKTAKGSLIVQVLLMRDQIDLTSDRLNKLINFSRLEENKGFTHVVTGIKYGKSIIASLESDFNLGSLNDLEVKREERNLEEMLKKLVDKNFLDITESSLKQYFPNFNIKIYSDFDAKSTIELQIGNFFSATQTKSKLFEDELKKKKETIVFLELTELSQLKNNLQQEKIYGDLYKELDFSLIFPLAAKVDVINKTKLNLKDKAELFANYEKYLSTNEINEYKELVKQFDKNSERLNSYLIKNELKLIDTIKDLNEICTSVNSDLINIEAFKKIEQIKFFLNNASNLFVYLNKYSDPIEKINHYMSQYDELYVLYYDTILKRKNEKLWKENYQLFLGIASNKSKLLSKRPIFILFDYALFNFFDQNRQMRIDYYYNKMLVFEDLLFTNCEASEKTDTNNERITCVEFLSNKILIYGFACI
jgi:hypothetical protein